MSAVHIALINQPEFYTNLDVISGKVILGISRSEFIGAVIVKLEGESKTALGAPDVGLQDVYPQPTMRRRPTRASSDSSQIIHENHKVLYKVQQLFPDEGGPPYSLPLLLPPGQHEWAFSFRLPFNNACSDPNAMAKIGGLAGAGGFAGPSFFGMGAVRLMDGSKQLCYSHVTQTLPPSFTGFPRQAEIRYYIKVTIQRPGLFKENFRHQLGFKFLPIEPPRPPPTNQEAYARRPFTFRSKAPGLVSPSRGPMAPPSIAKRTPMFSIRKPTSSSLAVNDNASASADQPPSIEISARIPHPSILTCNKPVPLRLIAKKLVDSRAECFLVSIQIELVGTTTVRCQDLVHDEQTHWVVTSRSGLAIPLQSGPGDAVGVETEISKVLWEGKPLPNTVMPSFVTCNLQRSYALDIKLGVSWGKPPGATAPIPPDDAAVLSIKASPMSLKGKGKGKGAVPTLAQTIFLPLHFSNVQVYSGLTPPESLAQAAMNGRKQQTPTQNHQQQQQQASSSATASSSSSRPRPSQSTPTLPPRRRQQQQQNDPLYPPQLRPGQTPAQAGVAAAGASNSASVFGEMPPPTYDEAPPSYDEAMAEVMLGPVVASEGRPAYSGLTNENAPDTMAVMGV